MLNGRAQCCVAYHTFFVTSGTVKALVGCWALTIFQAVTFGVAYA